MNWNFQAGAPATWQGSALVACVFEDENLKDRCPELLEAHPWLASAQALQDVQGTQDAVSVLYAPDNKASRILLVGLGKREKRKPSSIAEAIRRAGAAATRKARDLRLDSVTFPVSLLSRLGLDVQRAITELVIGAQLASHVFTTFKGEKAQADEAKKTAFPKQFALAFCDSQVPEALRHCAEKAAITAQAVASARDLINTPANALSPTIMAQYAKNLASTKIIKCKVMDAKALEEKGMGAHVAVGQGSSNPPCLITLEYAPKGHEKDKPLVIVGKGITFDSGGISIKPSAGMHEMKGDMGGAAVVLALFTALRDLEKAGLCLGRRVIGLLACAENMPSASAIRPGDIVKTLSGKTVEIVNTDAEGRLVLCDALTYAQEKWDAAALIDIATLTGACVVALGNDTAGIFSDDKSLVSRFRHIGAIVGEEYWHLPSADRYLENLKSDVADLSNCGPREAGATNAAVFLKQFINDTTRWVHLDIAGPSYASKKTANWPAGGTGFGVRSLLELIEAGVPEARACGTCAHSCKGKS